MIEKNCSNCVKWFDCKDRFHMYDSKIGEYRECEFAEVDECLDGRIAKCMYCNEREISRPTLPFFWYRLDKDYDLYYCGCYGWD